MSWASPCWTRGAAAPAVSSCLMPGAALRWSNVLLPMLTVAAPSLPPPPTVFLAPLNPSSRTHPPSHLVPNVPLDIEPSSGEDGPDAISSSSAPWLPPPPAGESLPSPAQPDSPDGCGAVTMLLDLRSLQPPEWCNSNRDRRSSTQRTHCEGAQSPPHPGLTITGCHACASIQLVTDSPAW